MATIDTLSERLYALQETTAQLQELIHRLANLKFAPGSVPLTSEGEGSENVATELSAEISSILREEEEELELLQEEIIDLRGGRPGSEGEHKKQRLKEGAQRLENELKTARTTFRKAQLSAHHSLLAAQKLERQLLVASYTASASLANSTHSLSSSFSSSSSSDPAQKTTSQQQQSNEDPRGQLFTPKDLLRHHRKAKPNNPNDENSAVVSASSDLTLSLRRTHAMIAAEVQKSAFASQTLAESSAALAELQKNYEGIDSLLSKSKNLVSTLLTTQKSDTWYLQTSLRLLLVTLAWLVFRRWLYGPLWWVVWLPLKMTYRTGKGVVHLASGEKQAAEMDVVLPGGTTTRVVIGEESVPTIQVAGPGVGKKQEKGWEGEEESYVEKVGRMMEDTLDRGEKNGENKTREDVGDVEEGEGQGEGQGEGRNPMKRMWEEDIEGQQQEQQVEQELVKNEL
ncbi:Sec20-domain-containing protein [Triangularia setosa]|uniref:Sec20-domain-containing protein n=1 Tax=Triangularia setosa TaxID=2587417 RepID=A0AAN6WGE3_9PEZI|nr:Sec20-domain-containing protein [Podospora setosa]